MVVVSIAGVSIPDVEERNHTDGVGDPETAIRAGNSCANCVSIRNIPMIHEISRAKKVYERIVTYHIPESS